jgi:hypothetical protein
MSRLVAASLMLALAIPALAQNCPPVDAVRQADAERECRARNGQWARFGVRDHLCNVYSCAERTGDGGKPCRDRSDCEHLCIATRDAPVGAEVPGQCSAVKTSFGCATHVDQGRVVGRICVD